MAVDFWLSGITFGILFSVMLGHFPCLWLAMLMGEMGMYVAKRNGKEGYADEQRKHHQGPARVSQAALRRL